VWDWGGGGGARYGDTKPISCDERGSPWEEVLVAPAKSRLSSHQGWKGEKESLKRSEGLSASFMTGREYSVTSREKIS